MKYVVLCVAGIFFLFITGSIVYISNTLDAHTSGPIPNNQILNNQIKRFIIIDQIYSGSGVRRAILIQDTKTGQEYLLGTQGGIIKLDQNSIKQVN